MATRLVAAIPMMILLWSTNASANNLVLIMDGFTYPDSSIGGVPIVQGTPFEVRATFSDVPFAPATGYGQYVVSTVSAEVGGVNYSAINLSNLDPDFIVILADPSYQLYGNTYLVGLHNLNGGYNFSPLFSSSSPTFHADAPTPTVFSTYLASISPLLQFDTGSGVLVLQIDTNSTDPYAGLSARIVASVPEPSSLAITGLGVIGIAMAASRRRLIYA